LDSSDDIADEAGTKIQHLVAEVAAIQDVKRVRLLNAAFDLDLFELDDLGLALLGRLGERGRR
jgi:hypothetical protein